MNKKNYSLLLLSLLFSVGLLLNIITAPPKIARAQQPTGIIPTVTGTPLGAYVEVYQDLGYIYVYAGPGKYDYPNPIGVLLALQQAPALGRSPDEQYIKIKYEGVPGSVGWVYALSVSLNNGTLQIIEVPPTPTFASTPTINPTLAAAFITQNAATRLPTYTAPAPIAIPAFQDETEQPSRIPSGLTILALAFIGALGTLISFLRGR